MDRGCEHNVLADTINQREDPSLFKQNCNDMFKISEKPLRSNLNFENQNRNFNLKNSLVLKGDGMCILHANHEQVNTEIMLPVSTKLMNNPSQAIQQQKSHNVEEAHVCVGCGEAFMKTSDQLSSPIIREFILLRNPMGAICVGKPLAENPGSLDIREFIWDSNRMNALIVTKPLLRNHSSINIGKVT